MELRVWQRTDELRVAVSAADRRHDVRRRLFLEVEDDGLVGFGEVSPLETSSDVDPSTDQVRDALGAALGTIDEIIRREGELPRWSRVHLLRGDDPAEQWAFALIEMALLDLELVRAGRRVDEFWPSVGTTPTMATCSLIDVERSWRPQAGASRVRAKTTGGLSVTEHAAWLGSFSLPVLLDFNASAPDASDVLRQVDELRGVELVAVEQPFGVADLVGHAELRARGIPISLDESVRSSADLRRIRQYEAASIVCIKAPRVGGLAAARDLLARCNEMGLRCYLGGYFESSLARRAHRAVAGSFLVEASDVAEVEAGTRDTLRSVGLGVVPALDQTELLSTLQVG